MQKVVYLMTPFVWENLLQRTSVAPSNSPFLNPLFSRNFGGLVLGRINASDSEARRIFQQFFEIYSMYILLQRSKFRE